MFRWPLACTAFAALLNCVGCSVQGIDAEPGAGSETVALAEHSNPDSLESQHRISADGSILRPSSGPGLESEALVDLPYLPTESALVEKDGISANLADEIIESQGAFSEALIKMARDEIKSMEAQDLAKHYRGAIERAVGKNGAVENLSCGLSVCVGSVRAASIADHDAWLSRLQEDPGADTFGFIEAIERTGDQFQSRFVFSTDPVLKAIVVH